MRNYQKIGFVGLGVMGLPMASNLLSAGYELVVFDLNTDRINELPHQENVLSVSSPQEVANEVNVLILMLPNSPHVQDVISGAKGIIHTLTPGSLIIDMSSISPVVTKELGEKLKQFNIDFLDAPVSGGQSGAINGTLTIMVGGKQDVLEEARPLLSIVGKKIIHCGDQGAGQIVKVVNQLMSAVNLVSMAEGFTLGVKGGVDPEIMREVISAGSGCSWAVNDRVPAIMERNFEPGFTVNLHNKDVTLALEMAKEMNVPLYATSLTHELFKTLQAKGKGGKDNSAIINLYEEIAGVEVKSTLKQKEGIK